MGQGEAVRRYGELAGAEPGTAVEETSAEDAWRTVSEEDRPKFDALRRVLEQQLSGVKVYKVGDEAERQLYFVGKAADDGWAGLKTTVVET